MGLIKLHKINLSREQYKINVQRLVYVTGRKAYQKVLKPLSILGHYLKKPTLQFMWQRPWAQIHTNAFGVGIQKITQ